MAVLIASVLHLVLGDERFLVLAVPAGVLAEVNVVRQLLLNSPYQFEHSDAMARLGRADEIVVAQIQKAIELVMRSDDAVGQFDRQNLFARRGPFDLLSVLV